MLGRILLAKILLVFWSVPTFGEACFNQILETKIAEKLSEDTSLAAELVLRERRHQELRRQFEDCGFNINDRFRTMLERVQVKLKGQYRRFEESYSLGSIDGSSFNYRELKIEIKDDTLNMHGESSMTAEEYPNDLLFNFNSIYEDYAYRNGRVLLTAGRKVPTPDVHLGLAPYSMFLEFCEYSVALQPNPVHCGRSTFLEYSLDDMLKFVARSSSPIELIPICPQINTNTHETTQPGFGSGKFY